MGNKSIVKNAVYKALLSIFNIIVPILIGPYAYRVLGRDLMGRIGFVESIYYYFYIFASFGIYQYGLREVSRIRDDKEKLRSLFSSLFIIGFITNIIVSFIYVVFIMTQYRGNAAFPVFMIYTVNILCNIFYVEWANEALERYNFITFKTIFVRIIFLILLFTLVKTSHNFLTYILITTFTTFLNYIISFVYIKKDIPIKFKGIKIRPHLKYLLMAVILANVNVLYTQLDRFTLGQYISEASVADYYLAQVVMSIINTLMLSIIYVTVPRLSNYLGNNDEATYVSLLDRVSKAYFAFLFPAAVGIFVLSKEIVLLYGGSELVRSIPVLKVFCFYMIYLGLESILTNQVMYVKRKERVLIGFILIGGTINLLSKILLIRLGRLTPVTAITTTVISSYVLSAIEYTYIRTKLKLNLHLFSFSKLKYLFIALLFIPVTLAIRMFTSRTLLIAAAGVLINSSLYLGILLLTKDSVIMMFADKMLARVRRKK